MSQMPTRAGRTQLFYAPSGAGGTPPPSSVQQVGTVNIVAGTQSYAIVFSPAFTGVPSFVGAQVQMPNDSGEVLFAVVDLSSLTAAGVTVWLNGIPSAAMAGGKINWVAHL
jgi:hypothetical protein